MKKFFLGLLMMSMVAVFAACGNNDDEGGTIILATTTSTYDAGLLDFLLPIFYEETGWAVTVISQGTGLAMQTGRDGEADVLLVHARALEDQFVADGYAERRYDIMYNDFIVLGPADGPIAHNTPINQSFPQILNDNLPFISRGDNSGTHVRELDVWTALGLDGTANENYIEAGAGMGATITMAIEMEAFTLSDRATWYNRPDRGNLVIVTEGSPDLLNPYGIMIVSTTLEPEGSRIFVDWMIGARGQELIGQFGVEEFGNPLFFPEAN
ncbi:MAG: substrate-binding domain-containing protein [Defluviitaleaceae bacterium]|nr:substrate-binding domain-containing protein [Defluviitaleaceae bacterium]